MDIVSVASPCDHDEIVAFLEARGLVENVWLLREVGWASRSPDIWRVELCRREGTLVGVAAICDFDKIPVGPSPRPQHQYEASMECVDRQAVEALAGSLPGGVEGRFSLLCPVAREYFEAAPGVERGHTDPHFTVSAERFRPVAGEEVMELTAADAELFEGCECGAEGDPLSSVRDGTGRKFAILRSGRVSTSATMCPLLEGGGTGGGVMAICGVFTESQYRNAGLGKRLVSHVTELILRDGHAPLYWTEPDNLASQALAKSLGYWQFGTMAVYRWCKP